jgi:hypothetical protein
MEKIMAYTTIQDWVDSRVVLRTDEYLDVKYRVVRQGDLVYQEICEADGSPIHTLKIPEGVRLDRSSLEVLLRYVLLDVVAA